MTQADVLRCVIEGQFLNPELSPDAKAKKQKKRRSAPCSISRLLHANNKKARQLVFADRDATIAELQSTVDEQWGSTPSDAVGVQGTPCSPFFLFMADMMDNGFVIVQSHDERKIVVGWSGVTFQTGTPLVDKSLVVTTATQHKDELELFCDACQHYNMSVDPGGDLGKRQCIHTMIIALLKRDLDDGFENRNTHRWSRWLAEQYDARWKPRLISDRAGVQRYAVALKTPGDNRAIAVCTVKARGHALYLNCSDLR